MIFPILIIAITLTHIHNPPGIWIVDNNLIKDGKIVDNVLDAIKDSDKEQFKKDVKHIAGQISGGEGSYSLSGKWRSYNVAQEKLKAIKDLATQLGV